MLVDATVTLTRASWELGAELLADELSARGAVPGALVTASGAVGARWFSASWAAAKLGAGLAGLPPGPHGGLPGALHVGPSAAGLPRTRAGRASRRLSGSHPLPDSVVLSAGGRVVRRSFTPEAVGAIGPVLADLVARLRAAPGTTLLAVGPVSDALVTFHANVVLVGGGRVVTASAAAEGPALAAPHGATAAVLSPGALDALAALDAAALDALDVMAIDTLVTGGAAVSQRARALAEDLVGADALIDVYATADTGVIAVRSGDEPHHRLLDGVEARVTAAGRLEVRSPLAAAAGWMATGDRARLGAGGALTLAA